MNDRTVLDVIDTPIVELIVQMNRIGLKTIYSCCGFDYPGLHQVTGYGHSWSAYVNFDKVYDCTGTHEKFLEYAKDCGWQVEDNKTTIRFPGYPNENPEYKKVSDGINRLVEKTRLLPSVGSEIRIVDGYNREKDYIFKGGSQL